MRPTEGQESAGPVPTDLRSAADAALALRQPSSYLNFYVREQCSIGLDHYMVRLRELGFEGREHVLDAGSGTGQWSVALSQLNRRVTAVDANPDLLDFAQTLGTIMARQNIDYHHARVDSLPFPDETFDAVFCHQVLMFARSRATIAEFARVLKPGAPLFINCNGVLNALYRPYKYVVRERNGQWLTAMGGPARAAAVYVGLGVRSALTCLPQVGHWPPGGVTERHVLKCLEDNHLELAGRIYGDGGAVAGSHPGADPKRSELRRIGGMWRIFEFLATKSIATRPR